MASSTTTFLNTATSEKSTRVDAEAVYKFVTPSRCSLHLYQSVNDKMRNAFYVSIPFLCEKYKLQDPDCRTARSRFFDSLIRKVSKQHKKPCPKQAYYIQTAMGKWRRKSFFLIDISAYTSAFINALREKNEECAQLAEDLSQIVAALKKFEAANHYPHLAEKSGVIMLSQAQQPEASSSLTGERVMQAVSFVEATISKESKQEFSSSVTKRKSEMPVNERHKSTNVESSSGARDRFFSLRKQSEEKRSYSAERLAELMSTQNLITEKDCELVSQLSKDSTIRWDSQEHLSACKAILGLDASAPVELAEANSSYYRKQLIDHSAHWWEQVQAMRLAQNAMQFLSVFVENSKVTSRLFSPKTEDVGIAGSEAVPALRRLV